MVLKKDGVSGLMFRGLGTKILSNGMQGLMFNVLWRMGMDWCGPSSSPLHVLC